MTTSTKRPDGGEAKNTDRVIWITANEPSYCDSIHVTEYGGIGIDCGGLVIVKPLREWHRLASTPTNESPAPQSAPVFKASHNSGERDPSVTLGCTGADTAAPHPPVEGLREALEPWRDELTEIIGHLGAAIIQSTASDDQIIMDHVKAAHEIAKIVRRKA